MPVRVPTVAGSAMLTISARCPGKRTAGRFTLKTQRSATGDRIRLRDANQRPENGMRKKPLWSFGCRSYEPSRELDAAFAEAMDDACDRTREVIEGGDGKAMDALHDEFASTWMLLMDEKDVESATFIAVLQGLLEHKVTDSVSDLKGPYIRAYKRLYNALRSLNWELEDERLQGAKKQQTSNGNNASPQPKDSVAVDYYEVLGVAPSAEKEEIRSAYRSLALKWHPDVNQTENASDMFLKIRKAYDVLSDPKSRKLYDTYGAEKMESMKGAHAGDGNADRFWDEFKPFKKQSRKAKARSAGLERMSDSESEDEDEPMAGDVVEYPLSDVVKAELQDGRESGVGLLVGRNKDRGDSDNLPPELLGMCEIEPLRQEATNSTRWIPDEIGCSAFCDLSCLVKIPVASYDGRFDIWVIECELSDGCGGPEIVEEIML